MAQARRRRTMKRRHQERQRQWQERPPTGRNVIRQESTLVLLLRVAIIACLLSASLPSAGASASTAPSCFVGAPTTKTTTGVESSRGPHCSSYYVNRRTRKRIPRSCFDRNEIGGSTAGGATGLYMTSRPTLSGRRRRRQQPGTVHRQWRKTLLDLPLRIGMLGRAVQRPATARPNSAAIGRPTSGTTAHARRLLSLSGISRSRCSAPLFATTAANADEPETPEESPAAALSGGIREETEGYQWTRQNMAIALPALIGMLADPLLSLMDTLYVGRLGSIELAALGACTSIFHLAFNAFRATTAATTSLVASELTTDPDSAKRITLRSMQLGLSMGIVVLATLLATGNRVLRSMGVGAQSELYPAASEYLFTRCWAAPVVLLITVAEGAFRGYGDTVVPLVASVTAAVINVIFDPLLMFSPPFHWGVRGAAAATALSQVGALAVYSWKLVQRRMLPPIKLQRRNPGAKATSTIGVQTELVSKEDSQPPPSDALARDEGKTPPAGAVAAGAAALSTKQESDSAPKGVIRTILGANLSMMVKQGSLLFGWAFATARATRLGAEQVAAHQVALSVWLVFALILDGTAVSAQVLMSRAYALQDKRRVVSLRNYMFKFALVQGLLSMLLVDGLDFVIPQLFTPDKNIQKLLHQVMPHLATQQILVSLTLVVESLAAGMNQFGVLAVGTTVATVISIMQIQKQVSVDGIWSIGITALFAGRLITASIAVLRARLIMNKSQPSAPPS